MAGVLTKSRYLNTDIQGESHMKTKAETRVMLLQEMECQRLPANHQNPEESYRRDSSYLLEAINPTKFLILDF